jgi:hypothetical protein
MAYIRFLINGCTHEQPIGPDSVQSLINPDDPGIPEPLLVLTNRNEIPTTRQPYKVTRSTTRGNSPRGAVSSTERPGSTYRAPRRHRDPMRSAFHAPAHSCYCTSHHRSSVLSYVARKPYARLPRSDPVNLRRPGPVWSLRIRYFSLVVWYSPVR